MSRTRRGWEPGGETTTSWLPASRRATSVLAVASTPTMELSMNEALTLRAFGLVGGPIENGAAAFLGWLIGGVLPERKGPAPV